MVCFLNNCSRINGLRNYRNSKKPIEFKVGTELDIKKFPWQEVHFPKIMSPIRKAKTARPF